MRENKYVEEIVYEECEDIKKTPACKREEVCIWEKNKSVEEVVSEEFEDIKKGSSV